MTGNTMQATYEESAKTEKRKISRLGKFLLEFGPLIIFSLSASRGRILMEKFPILAGFGKPIFLATALLIITTTISFIISWRILRRVPVMPLFGGSFVVFFGSLTLIFHNEVFIKIKPTVVHLFFASTLIIGLLLKKPFLTYVFEGIFYLDKAGWRKFTINSILFFFFMATMNEIVWRNFSTPFWATFKAIAGPICSFLFMVSQTILLRSHSLYKKGNVMAAEEKS